jgi:hypothetical protein
MNSKYAVAYTDCNGKLYLGIVDADDEFNAALIVLEDESENWEEGWNEEIDCLAELIDFAEACGIQLLVEEV